MTTEKNPNEKLAELIFQKLKAEGLATDNGKTAFIQNLAQGKLKEGSWKAALEQTIRPKQQNPPLHETSQT